MSLEEAAEKQDMQELLGYIRKQVRLGAIFLTLTLITFLPEKSKYYLLFEGKQLTSVQHIVKKNSNDRVA